MGDKLEMGDQINLVVKKPDSKYAEKVAFRVCDRPLDTHFYSSLAFRKVFVISATSVGRSRDFYRHIAYLQE